MMDKQRGSAGRLVPNEARVVGANIRALRRAAGLSQRNIGEILGISYQQVQKYEIGANRFPVEKLFILKNFYGIPYEMFFTGLADDPVEKIPWPGNILGCLQNVEDITMREKIYRVVCILAGADYSSMPSTS